MYFKKNWKMCCFSVVRDKTVCLICSKMVSAPKECSLHCNYETLRKHKFDVLEVKLREDKLKKLKCDLQWQQNMLTVTTQTNEVAVEASFTV